MECLDRSWCGMPWTDWLPIMQDKKAWKKVPDSPGLYRLALMDGGSVLLVGESQKSLRKDIKHLYHDLTEGTAHQFKNEHSADIYTLMEGSRSLQVSILEMEDPSEREKALMKALWMYRLEAGGSPPCNFGRGHPDKVLVWDKKQGYVCSDRSSVSSPAPPPSLPPLPATGSFKEEGWLGLNWTSWQDLGKKNLKKLPSEKAVYRIADASMDGLLALGIETDLKHRMKKMAKTKGLEGALFSYHLPTVELEPPVSDEMENDLNAAYLAEKGSLPHIDKQMKK